MLYTTNMSCEYVIFKSSIFGGGGAFFNNSIIPLALVGYEMIIANSVLRASYPSHILQS